MFRVLISVILLSSFQILVAQKPNIIVIISDDAGYADWEFMDDYLQTVNPGQAPSPVPTPNLNSLRHRGTLFTNAYTAAVCSPSRAAIVTGSYQQRIGYEYNINNLTSPTAVDGLSPGTVTIFDRIGAEGYTTGAIGKWHLGARANTSGLGNRPENQGVDEFFGIWKGSRNYTIGSVTGSGELRETITSPFSDTVLETTPPWNTTTSYVTNAFGTGAVDFIDRHYADEAPFFLYVSFTAPHGPIGPSPDINDPRISSLSGTRKNYASMVLTMDKEIGNILNKLDDPAGDGSVSLTDRTLVIFMNDNGGASGIGTVNTPLKNFKGSVFEGGTRVPMLIAGPGLPQNGTFHHPVHSIDILPTCLEASGATPPSQIDGVSLIPHLEGTASTPPHEVIVIRNGSRYSVRRDNWKLVGIAPNSNPALYDLANDISEATDVAAANPPIAAALLQDLTAFEVLSDKPRHASLNRQPDSINLNDRFVANPIPGTALSLTPDLTLIGNDLKNGNFNAGGGGGVQTYEQTLFWQNLGTGSQNENATNTSLSLDGSRNAIIAETVAREFAIETEHTLSSGEHFQTAFDWRDASAWNDASDRIRVTLFTTDNDTLNGIRTTIQSLDSSLSKADSAYQSETLVFTGNLLSGIPSRAQGKRLFVSMNVAQAGSGFARLDNFSLVRGSLDTGPAAVNFNWSDQDTWSDPQTSLKDTFLSQDSFAGAILEFPSVDTFSYTATNDTTRATGQTFMLNRLNFTGSFSAPNPEKAILRGNDLLFANDLHGNSPGISLDATSAGFSFAIENNFILYHDFVISGNGTSIFDLQGTISEFHNPVNVSKMGTSNLLLSTSPTYTGKTTITEGRLTLASDVNLSMTSEVALDPDGILAGDGTVSVPVTGTGTISPGESIGKLTATDDVQLGALEIEINDSSSDLLSVTGHLDLSGAELKIINQGADFTLPRYPIANYGTLTGGFETLSGIPSGFVVDYTSTENTISLVKSDLAYEFWSEQTHSLSRDDARFDADIDGDSLSNGIEFLTGTNPNSPNQTHPISYSASESSLSLSIPVASIASGIHWQLEFSTDLENWKNKPSAVTPPVSFEEEDHFYRPGLSRVSINYPFTDPGKIFIRLKLIK